MRAQDMAWLVDMLAMTRAAENALCRARAEVGMRGISYDGVHVQCTSDRDPMTRYMIRVTDCEKKYFACLTLLRQAAAGFDKCDICGGFTAAEAALILGVTPRTIRRWRKLYRDKITFGGDKEDE